MKVATLLALVLFAVVTAASGQSRPNRIYRPCPGIGQQARVEINRSGDVDLVPCVGRNLLLNGLPFSNGFTVSGSSRTGFLPYFSTETNLTKAPLSWNGSEFIFNNSAGDSPYTIRFKPASTGYIDFGGNEEGTRLFFGFDPAVFQVDVSHTEEPFTSYFYITGDAASLNAKNIGIGDDNGLLNSLLFRVNNITKQFVFTGDPAATTSVAFQRINQFYFSVDLKSIAICGNVTSNAAVGTVNICDGSSSATVTNPTVTANSIIFPVMRTNDATCTVKSVVPSAGSFIVTMNANCTAKTSIGWFVVNSAS